MRSSAEVPATRPGQSTWERSELLTALLQSASIGVAVVRGPDNRLELANPTYRQIIGWSEGNPEGLALRDVLSPAAAEAAERHIAAVYAGNRTVSVHEVPVQSGIPLRTTCWDMDYIPLHARDGGTPQAVLLLAVQVTEKVLARERLEALANQLSTILDSLPDGVLVLDQDGRVSLVNATFREWLGRDVLGEPLTQLMAEHHFYTSEGKPLSPEQTPIARALQGETITGTEVSVFLPGDVRTSLLESAAPLRTDGGHLVGAVLAATDVTALKQIQRDHERLLTEVEAAQRELRAIIDRLPDGVLVVDAQQRVTIRNETVLRYLGRDVTGMPIEALRYEYAFAIAGGQPFAPGQTPLDRALRGEFASGIEVQLQLPTGRRVDMIESVAPLYDPRGGEHISGAVVTLTDITTLREAQTERERLLAEVQGARRVLQATINRVPEAVLVLDPTMHVTLSNDAARRLIGRPLVGAHMSDLWKEHGLMATGHQPFPPGEAPSERALRGETVKGVEVMLQRPDGRSIDLLESAAPLPGPRGMVREVVLVMSNISTLKELDRAKDEFISVAAHELRTPLTSLKGHTQILLRQAAKQNWRPEERRSLDAIDEQVDRLNSLIGRLLDVSRIRLGRLQIRRETTDLVSLASEVAEEMQVTTDVHRIWVETAEESLTGQWDPEALRQVLSNLVGNAIKYAPGGLITVRLQREGEQALVSVTDQGPGISREQQARLFAAYSRGISEEYRRSGGLGLGLYISRGIIEAHGGHIWVESEPGQGTVFFFSLPLQADG